MDDTTWLVIATFIGSSVSIASFFAIYHYQKKQSNTTGMIRIFDLISNEANKLHRRRTYQAFCYGKIDSDGKLLDDDYWIHIEAVRTVFGQIGSLLSAGYAPMDTFLATYHILIIRLWKSLEKNILRERRLRGDDQYMYHFQWLYDQSIQYWRERNLGKDEPDPCNEMTREIMDSKRPDVFYSDIDKLRLQAELEELKYEIAKLKNDLESQKIKK